MLIWRKRTMNIAIKEYVSIDYKEKVVGNAYSKHCVV